MTDTAVAEKKKFSPIAFKTTIQSRSSLREAMEMAIMCRQHVLVVGPPGTAKTKMASEIFSQIDGGELFEANLTKFDGIERILGGIDLDALKSRGKLRYSLSGSLATADFAILDEFFDANDPLLRTTLGILNERRFRNGDQNMQVEFRSVEIHSEPQPAKSSN